MSRTNKKNKPQPTLRFNEAMKDELYWRLKRYDEIKYLRWHKDKSYLRFYIYDNAYQIVVSPQYKTLDHLPVSFNGIYVINATDWFKSIEEIEETVIRINNFDFICFTDEKSKEMSDYASTLNIDATKLGYDYINRGDKGFSISHSDEFDKVLDEFVEKYMKHFNITNGKFDVELQIVKLMAQTMFDYQVHEKEKQLCETLQQ